MKIRNLSNISFDKKSLQLNPATIKSKFAVGSFRLVSADLLVQILHRKLKREGVVSHIFSKEETKLFQREQD